MHGNPMNDDRKLYSPEHWLRSEDGEVALAAYLEQQSKAYSRVKNAYVRELLGDLRGKRFLDYGCGGGMFLVHAAQSGAVTVVGVDAEETALAAARRFTRQEGVENLCSFVRSEHFPVPTGGTRFDVILLKDVIEHVVDDRGLLRSAASALAPGGVVVVSTQNALSLNYLLEGSYRRLLLRDRQWFGWDETHVRFYTPMNLGRKLRDAGLSPARFRSMYLVPYKLPRFPLSSGRFFRIDALSVIDKVLGRVFPYNLLGWNIIVRAALSPLVAKRIRHSAPVIREPEAGLLPAVGRVGLAR